ncbi:Zinc finger BED domain-containing protein RICESLEEPER 2 [Sesamum angolense]|uniref:Zinc finger BED domain-containing protein RICESLEEPER 2 n=1 Tax=Sesamum angolense TaxID=2727404 RepID=A0AAE1XDD7_9LAMI|nr:Zinc finger BED domain-containing protein RICESLEEPER 2 [Sesamum angolense]
MGEDLEVFRKEFDILNWWKVDSHRFLILSKIARDILAVPVSIVASGSAFSTSGRVLDAFSSSLSPKIVQALICAQDWLRMVLREKLFVAVKVAHIPTVLQMECPYIIYTDRTSHNPNCTLPRRHFISGSSSINGSKYTSIRRFGSEELGITVVRSPGEHYTALLQNQDISGQNAFTPRHRIDDTLIPPLSGVWHAMSHARKSPSKNTISADGELLAGYRHNNMNLDRHQQGKTLYHHQGHLREKKQNNSARLHRKPYSAPNPYVVHHPTVDNCPQHGQLGFAPLTLEGQLEPQNNPAHSPRHVKSNYNILA